MKILNFLLWLVGCVGVFFFFNHLRSTCLTAKTLKIFSYTIFYSESINVWSFTFRSLLKLIPAYDLCQGPYFVLYMWIAAVSVTGHWSDQPCLAVLPVVRIKSLFAAQGSMRGLFTAQGSMRGLSPQQTEPPSPAVEASVLTAALPGDSPSTDSYACGSVSRIFFTISLFFLSPIEPYTLALQEIWTSGRQRLLLFSLRSF